MTVFKPRVQRDPACPTCAGLDPHAFYPPHTPSDRCTSGAKTHCTCGTCF